MDKQFPVDPLAYAADADDSVLEEIARLDRLRERIRSDQATYLKEHPEVYSLLNGFLRAVMEQKPTDVFAFGRDYFSVHLKDRIDVVVVAGPSGVGKGTIIQKLMEEFPQQVGFGCRHTTRERREGETDGVHYHFTSLESMREAIDGGEFLEHVEVNGNLYGTSIAAVEDVITRGQVCVLDIDVQGVKAVKSSFLRAKYVFVSPPSIEVLEKRLRDRSTETEESLSRRSNNSREEMEYGNAEGNFDVVIRNDNLDHALGELAGHLLAWFPRIEGGKGRQEVETREERMTNYGVTCTGSSSQGVPPPSTNS